MLARLEVPVGDVGLNLKPAVANKFIRRRPCQLQLDGKWGFLVRTLPTRPSPRPLLLHLRVESLAFYGEPRLPSHLLLFVERQTVSVVKLERRRTRQHAARCRLRLVVEEALR